MALHGKTPGKIAAAVKALKPFKIGNVSGSFHVSYGRLPEEHAAKLREAFAAGLVKYVLYSYATPMAWMLMDEDGNEVWIQPGVKYSVSTSDHQSTFAGAILDRLAEKVAA